MLSRTTQLNAIEMLILARIIVAYACCLIRTDELIRVDVMTVGHGAKTIFYVSRVGRMVTI